MSGTTSDSAANGFAACARGFSARILETLHILRLPIEQDLTAVTSPGLILLKSGQLSQPVIKAEPRGIAVVPCARRHIFFDKTVIAFGEEVAMSNSETPVIVEAAVSLEKAGGIEVLVKDSPASARAASAGSRIVERSRFAPTLAGAREWLDVGASIIHHHQDIDLPMEQQVAQVVGCNNVEHIRL